MKQKWITGVISGGGHDDVGDDILGSKLHLVDLAGSERANKMGADGMRSALMRRTTRDYLDLASKQEGIPMNKSLTKLK
ncbi:kinesin-like protein BC2 [Artemisia annua]|uniref:Kinesin-like protein BC2 n=1 Tax=Artemisia annua TaxID=35608 RepID=A0A2U1MZR5_ARTAN|nr:kinesin-like protein BC2 [Artemisia annua]